MSIPLRKAERFTDLGKLNLIKLNYGTKVFRLDTIVDTTAAPGNDACSKIGQKQLEYNYLDFLI